VDSTDSSPAVIRLALPPAAEFVQVARLTAAALATRAGFSIDEVDDLRIAIDELSALLVQSPGASSDLELRFEVAEHEVKVHGGISSAGHPVLSELSEKILEVVVDTYGIDSRDGHVSFHCEKRHSEDDEPEE
jgi:anti-sigma regulatory factor (Ser/Thr protein kinase)